jgi:hypothetical protein
LDPFALDLNQPDFEHSIVASNGFRKMEKDDGIVNHVKGLRFAGDVAGGDGSVLSPGVDGEREIYGEEEKELTRVCHFNNFKKLYFFNFVCKI